tara:strand:+ start:1209 stop:2108 length:900 start_codon:yes stop_codon:yes gene_type:complete
MAIKSEMLRSFAAVAEAGNLVDAAARLGRTPSAVSMTIKQLQDQLAEPLFASDRKNQLTAFGVFVLEQAQTEIAQHDQTRRAISGFASYGSDLIQIAAVPSVAGGILPRAISTFLHKHPKVRIEIRDMESAAIVRGVHEGAFDIGIATAPDSMLARARQTLCTDPFGIICARDHPLAQMTGPVTWSILRGETFIMNPLAATVTDPTFLALTKQSRLTAHNTLSLLSLVQAGAGVTVLPKLVTHMAWQPVHFLPVQDLTAQRKIDILHAPAAQITPLIHDLCADIHAAAVPLNAARTTAP